MNIPVEFNVYQRGNETLYSAHIQIGQREYRARINGKKALETIAEDILRLTVVAQVQNPEYQIIARDNNIMDTSYEQAKSSLLAMLHDTFRIQQAYDHVKNPPGTTVRTPILDSPSFPRYH